MKRLPIVLFLLFVLLSQALQAQATTISKACTHQAINSYALRYERYGLMGIYHVSLRVDVIHDGVLLQRLHIDGAGRVPKRELNLGFCKIKVGILPPFLAGYVNPKGYKQHFLGLFTSEEFGPTYTLSDERGTKLVEMAHHAMTIMNNSDKRIYFTIPFQVGPLQFWTSNSVVASLVKVANEERINLPAPSGGCYPGFNGPFLPKHLFTEGYAHEEELLSFPLIGVIFYWSLLLLLATAILKLVTSLRARFSPKCAPPSLRGIKTKSKEAVHRDANN